MPKDDDFGALLAIGLLAVGAGLVAAAATKNTNEAKRTAFHQGLAHALLANGLVLIAVTLGRGTGNQPFWDVTVQNALAQQWTQRVPLAAGTDAYAPATRDYVVAQVNQAA
jgi:hypothetical protein